VISIQSVKNKKIIFFQKKCKEKMEKTKKNITKKKRWEKKKMMIMPSVKWKKKIKYKEKNNIRKTCLLKKWKLQIYHQYTCYTQEIRENFNCAISIVKLCFLLVYTSNLTCASPPVI